MEQVSDVDGSDERTMSHLPTLHRWCALKPSGLTPTARCSHSATRVEEELYIIGGGYIDSEAPGREFIHLNDVWKLSIHSMEWSRLELSGDVFPARRGHSAAFDQGNACIIVFGGTDSVRMLNDTYELDTVQGSSGSCSWRRVDVNGSEPPGRRGHRAFMLGEEARRKIMLVVGGYPESIDPSSGSMPEQHRIVDEERGAVPSDSAYLGMYALYVSTWTWARLRVAGFPPRGLALFGCACVDGNRLVTFGGHQYASLQNDLSHTSMSFCAELDDLLQDDGSPGELPPVIRWWPTHPLNHSQDSTGTPPPRFALELIDVPFDVHEDPVQGHGTPLETSHVVGKFAIFGGTGRDDEVLDDLYYMTLRRIPTHARLPSQHNGEYYCQYSRISLELRPRPRNGMTITRVDERMVMFGGGVFAREYYNDLWGMELAEACVPLPPPPPPITRLHLEPHVASLVGSDRFSDIEIELDDGGPPVPAHRLLLASGASRYFSAMLGGGFREGGDAGTGERLRIKLPRPDIGREVLLDVLRWLYVGSSPFHGAPSGDGGRAVALLQAADALDADGLRSLCTVEIARCTDLSAQVLDLLVIAEQVACESLFKYGVEWLRERAGVWRRGGHSAVGAAAAAVVVSELQGFDALSEAARERISSALAAPMLLLPSKEEILAAARETETVLSVGIEAVIHGLERRADLNGCNALLLSEDEIGGRWACRILSTHEAVRIRPRNLDPFEAECSKLRKRIRDAA